MPVSFAPLSFALWYFEGCWILLRLREPQHNSSATKRPSEVSDAFVVISEKKAEEEKT